MKKEYQKQGGFMPFIAIALIAALAVGGGVYVAKKKKEHKIERSENTETKANENANLGVGASVNTKTHGSLKSFLGLKKNTICTFQGVTKDVTSSGTVYVSADGNMRGDFTVTSPTIKMAESHFLVKGQGAAYAWTGTQGTKMNLTSFMSENSSSQQSYVNPNTPVSYDCKDWVVDEEKFTLPTGVTFVDIDAFIKTKLPGGVVPKM